MRSLLNDVVLSQWPAAQVARVRKRREVDGTVFSESDEFGERTADRRRVLQSVAAEAACENQIGHRLACAQERILIEDVIVVVSRPGAGHPDGLERGYAMSQRRPREFLEQMMIDLKVVQRDIGIIRGHHSADEAVPFRPKPQTGWVDDQGTAGGRRRTGEYDYVPLSRMDGKIDSRLSRDRPRVGAR